MNGSGVRLAHEVAPGHRAAMQGEAVHWRTSAPRPNRAPRDEYEARKFARADQHKVYIKGRFLPDGRRVFDVFRILGPGKMEITAAGCLWYEEAVALAMDAMLGRISISMTAGQRTVLEQRAGMLAPNRGIWLPGGTTLDVRPTSDPDVSVVRPRFQEPPKRLAEK